MKKFFILMTIVTTLISCSSQAINSPQETLSQKVETVKVLQTVEQQEESKAFTLSAPELVTLKYEDVEKNYTKYYLENILVMVEEGFSVKPDFIESTFSKLPRSFIRCDSIVFCYTSYNPYLFGEIGKTAVIFEDQNLASMIIQELAHLYWENECDDLEVLWKELPGIVHENSTRMDFVISVALYFLDTEEFKISYPEKYAYLENIFSEK